MTEFSARYVLFATLNHANARPVSPAKPAPHNATNPPFHTVAAVRTGRQP